MLLSVTRVITLTVSGLSTPDLLEILSICVVIFGLLLTAIGVLVLRMFRSQQDYIEQVKKEVEATCLFREGSAERARLQDRGDMRLALEQIWAELKLIRGKIWNTH